MIPQESLLIMLVRLIDRIPMPPPPKAGRGRPKVYPDRLFLKALVIMIVRHLYKVHELLSVLGQPTAEMQTLRGLLTENMCYPGSHAKDFNHLTRRKQEHSPPDAGSHVERIGTIKSAGGGTNDQICRAIQALCDHYRVAKIAAVPSVSTLAKLRTQK